MELLFILIVAIVLCFGVTVFFGAPYLPTLKPQITTALDMLELKSGQTMLEIGSGDGRVLRAAAARGWHVIGYELNPILVLISLWVTRKYRKQVRVIWGDAFRKNWPVTDGIFIFGLDRLMPKLNTKVVQSQQKPVKVVSFTFRIPEREPDAHEAGVFLYKYR